MPRHKTQKHHKHNTKRFSRRKSTLLNRFGQRIGFSKRTLNKEDKANYLNELRVVYQALKRHKHNPKQFIHLADLQDVSPVYVIRMLADIQRKYSWSIVNSVPASENAFLKAVIRIVHRMLETTTLTEANLSQQTVQKSQKSVSSATCVSFIAMCRHVDIPIGKYGLTAFAPSDASLEDPFWKVYLQYAKQHKSLLKTLLQMHMVASSYRTLHSRHMTHIRTLSGQNALLRYQDGITHINKHTILSKTTYKDTDILIVDGLMGVLKPFGITVFQREMMQSQLTSLCMCLSKRACTSPCGLSYLTCTYKSGGLASTKADAKYTRALMVQSVKEYFLLTALPMYLCFAYFPIVENAFGQINIVKMTRSLNHLFAFIALPNTLGAVFTHVLNKLSITYINKYINILFNPNTLGTLVFAPIFEEIMCRGLINSGFKKLLNIFPPPTHAGKKNKNKQKPSVKPGTRRRSSTFDDLFDEVDLNATDARTWREWLTLITVSLIFGACHTLNHRHKNQANPLVRQYAFIHVLVCTVAGFGMHVLAEHRGLHVSMLRHFIHNFLCGFILLAPSKRYLEMMKGSKQ